MSTNNTLKFSERVRELQNCLDKECGAAGTKSRCVPTMLIAGAVVPFLVWLVLYFAQPGFVKKKEGDENVRDTKKVFMWTLGITVLVWAAMYGYVLYTGYNKTSMTCTM